MCFYFETAHFLLMFVYSKIYALQFNQANIYFHVRAEYCINNEIIAKVKGEVAAAVFLNRLILMLCRPRESCWSGLALFVCMAEKDTNVIQSV